MSAACRKCGACCRWPIIEAEYLDVLREPRIAVEGQAAMDNAELPEDEHVWILCPRPGIQPGTIAPCPFLDPLDHCAIYPTRPNACVAMEPDGRQCRMAREMDKAVRNREKGA